MKLIIFQREFSAATISGYRNSVKMAYMLNCRVGLAGIGETEYLLPDIVDGYSWEKKIELLLTYGLEEEINRDIIRFRDVATRLSKIKNKSSKEVVNYQTLKKMISKLYASYAMTLYNGNAWGMKTMKDLLDGDRLYFYHLEARNALKEDAVITDAVSLLGLDLPDPEKGVPLFFINLNTEDDYVVEIDMIGCEDKFAENLSNFYGMESFVFPLTNALTSNETKLGRDQLEGVTAEFREKVEEWAGVCYANPNSNVGLAHFRKHLQGFLPGLRDRAEESPIVRNVAGLTGHRNQGRMIVGEAPIQRIWEIYLESDTISVAEYQMLLRMKKKQYPKYEGRWPVLFFERVVDLLEEDGIREAQAPGLRQAQAPGSREVQAGDEVMGVSKRIAVD